VFFKKKTLFSRDFWEALEDALRGAIAPGPQK
jgi:hypothetical protein